MIKNPIKLNPEVVLRVAKAKAKKAKRERMRGLCAQRLTQLREKTRLSRQEFAKRHNIPYGSLQNWEDPKYGGLTPKGAERVVDALKKEGIFVTLQWLLHGTGVAPYISAAVLLKRMQFAAHDGGFGDCEESVLIEAELEVFKLHNPNHLHARDGQGNYCAGKRFEATQVDRFLGMRCLGQMGSGAVGVGVLKAGDLEKTYSLQGADPQFHNTHFVGIAPVLWHRVSVQSLHID